MLPGTSIPLIDPGAAFPACVVVADAAAAEVAVLSGDPDALPVAVIVAVASVARAVSDVTAALTLVPFLQLSPRSPTPLTNLTLEHC